MIHVHFFSIVIYSTIKPPKLICLEAKDCSSRFKLETMLILLPWQSLQSFFNVCFKSRPCSQVWLCRFKHFLRISFEVWVQILQRHHLCKTVLDGMDDTLICIEQYLKEIWFSSIISVHSGLGQVQNQPFLFYSEYLLLFNCFDFHQFPVFQNGFVAERKKSVIYILQ